MRTIQKLRGDGCELRLGPMFVRLLRFDGESGFVDVRHHVHQVDVTAIDDVVDRRLRGAHGDVAEVDRDDHAANFGCCIRRYGQHRNACDAGQLKRSLVAEPLVYAEQLVCDEVTPKPDHHDRCAPLTGGVRDDVGGISIGDCDELERESCRSGA